jgi:xanthine dehydrogenase YagT iron-sulfur-binding subunit
MGRRRKDPGSRRSISRRGFLTSVGTAPIAGAAIGHALETPAAVPEAKPREPVNVVLKVNGHAFKLQVEPRDTLLTSLREKLGMTGTKPGCERGECGACTVLIDGIPRYACLTLALEAAGHDITTIEGLMNGEQLGPVQKAFVEEDAMQCGYCTPGQVMAAEALLRANPNPSLEEIRLGMSGNLCRCGAYDHIFKAVQRAAQTRRTGGV